ncbi:Cyclin Ctk2 [Taphrina deformans PYCC 5710]|uniref:Cyclin Ctk2 n=1 Tax=Taphrina deformans (strain PYCC 5710 / ATCC 11124 / CBS 356.35 / IMI 108563 / JCM 9778 / NBRC 8474) TaxID=1097556 RepID=R4XBQ6_TAPDE|nr:Cyclin Ctk2 [Taphrina deformans PYCC 5710]|eukprot:CCG83010.2 Cyclin Ctk2 [Taphrina deformans PYCC 5710]
MMIYHRFHLSNPIAEFLAQDVCAACLFVAAKMEDTSKKAKDILLVSHALRNPQSPDLDPESSLMEEQRRRVMGLERMILESCAFDFRHRHPQAFLLKFAHALEYGKVQTRLAWDISLDAYRTWLPLQVPPHVTALACLILSTRIETTELQVDIRRFEVEQAQLQLALESLLDLYLHAKGVELTAKVCAPEKLMEIKSTLLRDLVQEDNANGMNRGKSGGMLTSLSNLTSIGDRGTCRYILDPGRMET